MRERGGGAFGVTTVQWSPRNYKFISMAMNPGLWIKLGGLGGAGSRISINEVGEPSWGLEFQKQGLVRAADCAWICCDSMQNLVQICHWILSLFYLCHQVATCKNTVLKLHGWVSVVGISCMVSGAHYTVWISETEPLSLI